MIIIFSISNEFATSQVMKRLQNEGQQVLRINGDDDTFKFVQISKNCIYFKNIKTNETYNLLKAKSCWWRRTGLTKSHFVQNENKHSLKINKFDLSELVSGDNSILHYEAMSLRNFIYHKIYNSCSIHIGSPWRYEVNKLQVLSIAESYGLKTPKYEIITSLNQIKNNQFSSEKFVTKAISEGIYKTIGKNHFYSYTESYNINDFPVEKNKIQIFPSLIMEQIEKQIEIRSFYLDGNFYSMAIFSQKNQQTEVDFRKYDSEKPNKCEPFQLPKSVEEKLEKIYKALNLSSGSADLILDKNGEYVFLEINPVGQYHMTGEPCNYDLDGIIANYLIKGKIK